MMTDIAHRLTAAILSGLLCLGAAACSHAQNSSQKAETPGVAPEQSEPLVPSEEPSPAVALATESGALSQTRAWIDAMPGPDAKRRLIVEAVLETPCANAEAALEGVGGFGVTGRTYLVEAKVTRPEICLTAMGVHELRFETELAANAVYDDAAIRMDGEIALIPLTVAQ